MSAFEMPLASGSWRDPAIEHATVADAMHAPLLACPRDTPLVSVARVMTLRHVHAIATEAPPGAARPWAIVTDLAILEAGLRAEELTAGDVAVPGEEAAQPDWPLERAARLMAERRLHHLVVAGPDGHPVGMLSSLDVAGVIAWGRA